MEMNNTVARDNDDSRGVDIRCIKKPG